MDVIVAGGTGFVGSEIAQAMAEAGHRVRALSRSQPAPAILGARVEWLQGDVLRPGELASALAGADAVVDAVQMPNSPIEDPKKGLTFERFDLQATQNLVDASKAAGVQKFIGLSGVGAAEDGRYHWLRCKWQEEQHIAASGLDYTIFRPSWAFGPRDAALNRFLGFARWLPFVPVIGDGKTRINPVYARDIGRHTAAALELPAASRRVFEIGGPQVLTMDEIIRTALRVSGKRRFLLHNPVWLMKPVAGLVQHFPGRPLTPGSIDFITMDGVADTKELSSTFQLPLTPLEEALREYLG